MNEITNIILNDDGNNGNKEKAINMMLNEAICRGNFKKYKEHETTEEKKTYIDDIATKCWGKEVTTTDWHFTHDSIEQILANYFDIDLKQANKERDAIYKQMVKTLNQTNER